MSVDGQNTSPTPEAQPVKSSGSNKFSPLLLILVVLGLLISVGAAAVIWFQPKASPPPQVVIEVTPAPVAKPVTLDVTSPTEGEVAVNSEILVKGKTLPNVTVAVFTESDEDTIESDASGNFETTITLVEGINSLTVIAMTEEGEEKMVTLDVVYDTQS